MVHVVIEGCDKNFSLKQHRWKLKRTHTEKIPCLKQRSVIYIYLTTILLFVISIVINKNIMVYILPVKDIKV